MTERRRVAPPRLAGLLALLAVVQLLALLVPAAALGASRGIGAVDQVTIADVPDTGGEDCVDDPDAHPGVGLRECPKPFDVGSVLPFVAGGVAILLAVAVGWFLVMRRRVSQPFLADDVTTGAGGGSGGDWWTCTTCGASNVVGSARCYKCGSWPR
jgi:hypothetical protein